MQLVKMINSEANAVSGRFGGKVTYRTKRINVDQQVENFIKAYFHDEWYVMY